MRGGIELKIKLLVIVGESGAGKSEIASLLAQNDKYNYIQSYTTRRPRFEGEEGHLFTDKMIYDKHCKLVGINDFKIIAPTYFDDTYYWSVSTQFKKDKINIYLVDPLGVEKLIRENKNFNITTVYLKTDEKTRIKRMLHRIERIEDPNAIEDEKLKIDIRINNDRKVFKSIKCDYVVDANNKVEEVLETVNEIVENNM